MTTDTTQTAQPRVVPAGKGRRGHEIDGLPAVRILLDAAAGAGFSVAEYRVPARFSPPPHLHRHTREGAVLVVQEGELHYWFEDGDAVLQQGALLHLPPGAWFRWANEQDAPARLLMMFAPAGFEKFFIDVADAVHAGGELPVVLGAIRARYGDEAYPSLVQP
jgi:quercetin dioxygenase-like cupin family protein